MFSEFSQFFLMIVPLVFAVTIHEAAHAYAAFQMGDDTARLAGRLTLNPVRHLDPVGSFLLPLILKLSGSPFVFGYAKPVPVNSVNFRDYRKGMIVVASAGVAANLILAVLSGIMFKALIYFGSVWADSFLEYLIMPLLKMLNYNVIINLVLAVFNLIPVPPLDGSKIFAMLLPPDLRMKYSAIAPYGMFIIIALLMTRIFDKLISVFVLPLYKFLTGI